MMTMTRLILGLLIVALAACSGAPSTPDSATAPQAGGGATAVPTSAPSATSFGQVTLSGALSGTFNVESVTAVALDGNVSIQLGMGTHGLLVFTIATDALSAGSFTLGDPETADTFATLTTAQAQEYLSASGTLTLTQNGELFDAAFSLEAAPLSVAGQLGTNVAISGNAAQIAVAGEAG